MDETMCRPGYVWNDTLKRCLGAGGGDPVNEVPTLPEPENPAAPAQPVANGRGSVRVNANGIVQKGTAMGQSIAI